MKSSTFKAALALASLLLVTVGAQATIDGVTSQTFTLTAKPGYISTPDGNSIFMWGYANGGGAFQYPGVTMIVYEDQPVTVTLENELPVPASILFPGQVGVSATGGSAGLLTTEAPPAGSVTYSFTPSEPGTYMYHSGTHPELQVEMGLVGTLIVRPSDFDETSATLRKAYAETGSEFDREYLFLLTEIDPVIHEAVEQGEPVDLRAYWPVYWTINGRCAVDTLQPPNVVWLPGQPYNCLPLMEPGERLLMRVIGAGRDQHPYHHHLNHATMIAQDGRPLKSPGSPTIDRGIGEFTIPSVPGGTIDSIFTWTGAGLGWDIYGHQHDRDEPPLLNFPGPEDVDHNGNGILDVVAMAPNEYAPDHGKPFPVVLPEAQDLTFGGFWKGSPFLGVEGGLPPGEGGLNPWGGNVGMWHSHTEKEMVNNDIFPGGMMTMLIITPPGTLP